MNKKIKIIVGIVIFAIILFVGISTVNATVNATRSIYANDGSMKFEFTGLTLDTNKEYEFALTNTVAENPEDWYIITDYTATTATINISMQTTKLRETFNKSDKGYITIREKDATTAIIEPYQVDLKLPYMQVTNYTVIPNGKEFKHLGGDKISVPLRTSYNSSAYYQYEKITDANVINKYKELKKNNGNYLELQNIIKTVVPETNWKNWEGFYITGTNLYTNGEGLTETNISVPDTGLYYMWLYFAGKDNIKPLYGVILVDNLQPDIALESISISKTKTVELGKTTTLTPTFNPTNATNKIVTWTSSDETVATVSNAGVITPKKIGSTIITVTSQDGNKKATCTVTVTSTNTPSTTSPEKDDASNQNKGGSKASDTGKKSSEEPEKKEEISNKPKTLPKTGIGISLIIVTITALGISIVMYKKNKFYRGI